MCKTFNNPGLIDSVLLGVHLVHLVLYDLTVKSEV